MMRDIPINVLNRIVTVLVGVSFVILASGLREPYVFATFIEDAPALWDTAFYVTALSCLWWGARPQSFAAYVISSVLIVVSGSSRLLAFLFLAEDGAQWAPAGGWMLVLILAGYTWPRMWEDFRRGRG